MNANTHVRECVAQMLYVESETPLLWHISMEMDACV